MGGDKKWVVAQEKTPIVDKVDSRVEEDQEMETMENPDSVIEECPTDAPNTLMNNGMAFRPFTPPFAQLQSSSTKLKQSLQCSKESVSLKESVKGGNAGGDEDFGGINEVFGEDDEKVDVVYDPILKCYYDPKSGNYYQLSN